MTSAEMTTQSSVRITDSNLALNKKKMYLVYATGVNATDYITFNKLTTVDGCFFTGSDGTAGAFSIGTNNKITFTNGNGVAWSGLVWGS